MGLSLQLRIKSPLVSRRPSLPSRVWLGFCKPGLPGRVGRAGREDKSERFLSHIAWAKCGPALLSGRLLKAAQVIPTAR